MTETTIAHIGIFEKFEEYLSQGGATLTAIEEFCACLPFIWGSSSGEFTDRLTLYLSELKLKPDELQGFVNFHTEFYNSIVKLLDYISDEDADEEEVEDKLDAFTFALVNRYGEDRFKEIINQEILIFMDKIFDIHRLDASLAEDPDAMLGELEEIYPAYVSRYFAEFFSACEMSIGDPKSKIDAWADLFKEFLYLAVVLNIRRKEKLVVREMLGESGRNRNQPCPCGSGKNYKHCCLL